VKSLLADFLVRLQRIHSLLGRIGNWLCNSLRTGDFSAVMRSIRSHIRLFACFFPSNREWRGRWLAISVALIAWVAAGLYSVSPPSLDRSRSASVLVLAADGSILRGFLTADGKWRLPVEPAAVDPLYRRMLIAAEDRRFEGHPGADPIAAARALLQLGLSGHVVSGASTLTMQAVRLLEPHPRSLAGKFTEMAKAVALERLMTKDQVLGLYLTLAPFGGNLEGVRAASLAYFGKEPTRLSAAEAALLVAIPRAPERLRPDRHPEAARAARDRILQRMARQQVISPAVLTEARAEPGTSLRSSSPSGVSAMRPSFSSLNTPTLASRRNTRRSAAAFVSVFAASSAAGNGPAPSRSAMPSRAARSSARDT